MSLILRFVKSFYHYNFSHLHYRRTVCTAVLLVVISGFSNIAASEQRRSVQERSLRPSVGLALSGGGARGAAHLGVIQVLEEHRIPIDYIAGTSIGAYIGGLYSTGMGIDEIETAMEKMTWNKILDDQSTRTERSFRRKRDDDLYLIEYQPGLAHGKLKLPRGFLQGQKVDLELTKQLLPVADIDDFDQLTIPFRAIATDISSGQQVVLSHGNLAHSIRASMSIPAVIAPAYIDGNYLVDGGVANNLPINVVKAMGADIVIAIDIGTPLSSQDQLNSALAVTGQMTGFLTQRGSQEQKRLLSEHDLLITPELGDVRTADINEYPEAIQAGKDAANAVIDELEKLSLSPVDYAVYRNAFTRPDQTLPVIGQIEIINSSTLLDRYIRRRLVETHIDQPLDIPALERDIARLYGLGLFENIFYELENKNQETVLKLTLRERSWGPNYLQFGAQYNSDGGGENVFNLGVSYLATQLNSRAGEWRTGFQLGSEVAAYSEIHQPFGSKGMYFINPLLGYQERITNISQSSESIASLGINDTFAGLDIGREIGTWGEIRAGIRVSRADIKRRIGVPPIEENTLNGGDVFLRFSLDEFDSLFFPQEGSRLSLEWLGSRKSLGADSNHDQLKFSAGLAKTRNRNSFVLSASHDTTVKGTATTRHLFSLGGFGQLSGFLKNEFNGQHRALISATAYRKISHSQFLPLYAGIAMEHGLVSETRRELTMSNIKSAGTLWLGADTIVGPIYVAYGRGEGGESAWYLFLGSPF